MNGAYLIGGEDRTSSETFSGMAAATGQSLDGDFAVTPLADIAQACALAAAAFDAYRETARRARVFLEAIATALEARAEAIIARAMLESGLPQAPGRRTGPHHRPAAPVCHGRARRRLGWRGDRAALPDRQPLPRRLASRAIPLGPVAVFGASNFPLAFSVARWRHRLGPRRRLPGGGQGASGPPRHLAPGR
jgi:NADP-dependent aldehyde dehydrogenase